MTRAIEAELDESAPHRLHSSPPSGVKAALRHRVGGRGTLNADPSFVRRIICLHRPLTTARSRRENAKPLVDRLRSGYALPPSVHQRNFLTLIVARVSSRLSRGSHLPAEVPIELWWQDEMRLGQKNSLVRQWARKGTRPRQPKDQRYQSLYIFGSICPARGTGAALAMPWANTHAMQAHPREISRQVAPGAHAALLLDRAGWHITGELKIPKNITLLFLPSKAPELNPVENIWQFLRQTYLSNRVFETYEQILDAPCHARNRLIDQPWRIMSIGLRNWAHKRHSL